MSVSPSSNLEWLYPFVSRDEHAKIEMANLVNNLIDIEHPTVPIPSNAPILQMLLPKENYTGDYKSSDPIHPNLSNQLKYLGYCHKNVNSDGIVHVLKAKKNDVTVINFYKAFVYIESNDIVIPENKWDQYLGGDVKLSITIKLLNNNMSVFGSVLPRILQDIYMSGYLLPNAIFTPLNLNINGMIAGYIAKKVSPPSVASPTEPVRSVFALRGGNDIELIEADYTNKEIDTIPLRSLPDKLNETDFFKTIGVNQEHEEGVNKVMGCVREGKCEGLDADGIFKSITLESLKSGAYAPLYVITFLRAIGVPMMTTAGREFFDFDKYQKQVTPKPEAHVPTSMPVVSHTPGVTHPEGELFTTSEIPEPREGKKEKLVSVVPLRLPTPPQLPASIRAPLSSSSALLASPTAPLSPSASLSMESSSSMSALSPSPESSVVSYPLAPAPASSSTSALSSSSAQVTGAPPVGGMRGGGADGILLNNIKIMVTWINNDYPSLLNNNIPTPPINRLQPCKTGRILGLQKYSKLKQYEANMIPIGRMVRGISSYRLGMMRGGAPDNQLTAQLPDYRDPQYKFMEPIRFMLDTMIQTFGIPNPIERRCVEHYRQVYERVKNQLAQIGYSLSAHDKEKFERVLREMEPLEEKIKENFNLLPALGLATHFAPQVGGKYKQVEGKLKYYLGKLGRRTKFMITNFAKIKSLANRA